MNEISRNIQGLLWTYILDLYSFMLVKKEEPCRTCPLLHVDESDQRFKPESSCGQRAVTTARRNAAMTPTATAIFVFLFLRASALTILNTSPTQTSEGKWRTLSTTSR